MEQKQLRKFKAVLESRAQELRRSLAESHNEGYTPQEAHGRDEADRASRSHDAELLFVRSAQVRSTLKGIEAALRRVNEGTFGECINCGQEISVKRLEAVPWTRYCITCQEIVER